MNIKELFKRGKSKEKSPYEGGNISGGNSYETQQKLLNRDEQAKSNTPSNHNSINFGTVGEAIKSLNDTIWKQLTINEWTLLKLNADYFINMIKFKANSTYLIRVIQNLIKCAYIYGKAAIYVRKILNSEPLLRVVVPLQIEYDLYNKPNKVEIIDFSNTYLENGFQTPENLEKSETLTKQEDIDNVIVFKWGINAIDSFQRMLPFVKYQSELLDMIVTASYGFIKKYDLIYNGTTNDLNEMLKMYFSAKNPFNIKYGNVDLYNKIVPINIPHADNNNYVLSLLDFYKESTNIMYGLNGRRSNLDNKRERNITSEVEANQTQFDNLEFNILNEFEIFVKDFNENEDIKKGGYQIEFSNLSNKSEDRPTDSDNRSELSNGNETTNEDSE